MADYKLPRSKPFSWTGGWTSTSPRGVAAIAQKYGDPMTRWLASPPVQNPNLPDTTADGVDTSPDAVTPTAPAGTATPPTETPAPDASPAPLPTPAFNPNVGNRVEQNWMDRGGSLATLHQAQVANGVRPVIDARATRSPADFASGPSADIRRGWGWPDTAMGDTGTQIWDNMTKQFDNSEAATQAKQDHATRLATAKAKLAREFGPAIPAAPRTPTPNPNLTATVPSVPSGFED